MVIRQNAISGQICQLYANLVETFPEYFGLSEEVLIGHTFPTHSVR